MSEGAPAHRTVRADPLAIAALSVGAAAFVMDCCCMYLGPVLSVTAVILGAVAIAKARKGSRADMAIGVSALVAGVLNLLLFAVMLVFYAGLLMHDGNDIFPVFPDGAPPTSDASAPLGTAGPMLPAVDAGSTPASSVDASAADAGLWDASVDR
ncbi:MAG: hypothetical protein GXP55_09690 [Deltaproteobacteria bacterium]|nr:hypothetical protein [Deltaproteobacteria bacterium]